MEINMKIEKRFVDAAAQFYEDCKKDENGRDLSWEHCYLTFSDARKDRADYDYLSLHLAFYLASWGMYRGSTFLLNKDYRIHIPVVKIIMENKYDCLLNMNCIDIAKDKIHLIMELDERIKSYYRPYRGEKGEFKSDVSKTLITKILLGTLACTPAYDEYFIKGVTNAKVATGVFSANSLVKLCDFYTDYKEMFEKERSTMICGNFIYPHMKMIDMGFWRIGKDIEEGNKKKKK